MSDIEAQIWQKYKDQDVIVFGIAVDEPVGVVQDFINQFQLTYPVLLGNGDLKNAYNIAGNHVSPFPRDFIIGRDGKIAYASDEYDPEAMIEVVESQLTTSTTDDDPGGALIKNFRLAPTYPNPLDLSNAGSHGARITYDIGENSRVSLKVFDMTGRLIRTLVLQDHLPGTYHTRWDGRDTRSNTMPSGMYILRLKAGSYQKLQRIVLLQ